MGGGDSIFFCIWIFVKMISRSQRYLVLYFRLAKRLDELSKDLRDRVESWIQLHPTFGSSRDLHRSEERVWRE